LAPLNDPENDSAQGLKAPVAQGASFNGMEMTLRPNGQPMLLVFLAHWCPHCNAEIPRLIEWKESGQMPEDLNVIGVATGSRSDQPNWPPSQWLQDMEWPWPAMADSEAQDAAIAYGVNGYPGLVLIDGDGTVLARRSGEASVSELDAWAETYLGS
jgi:thiol-disulfide isomerase/thioredoxin